jgi:hypothetical protein
MAALSVRKQKDKNFYAFSFPISSIFLLRPLLAEHRLSVACLSPVSFGHSVF